MSKYCEDLILSLLDRKRPKSTLSSLFGDIDEKEITGIQRVLVDTIASKLFEEIIESTLLCEVFSKLPHTQRLVILLHVLMNYEIDETAEILGSNCDSIYSQKHKALRRFKEELGKI